MDTAGSTIAIDARALAAERAHTVASAATANRQRTNLIWERTQAAIAIGTTLAYIIAQLIGKGLTTEGLANAFFLVIGFYFGRTNHARPSAGNLGVRQAEHV